MTGWLQGLCCVPRRSPCAVSLDDPLSSSSRLRVSHLTLDGVGCEVCAVSLDVAHLCCVPRRCPLVRSRSFTMVAREGAESRRKLGREDDVGQGCSLLDFAFSRGLLPVNPPYFNTPFDLYFATGTCKLLNEWLHWQASATLRLADFENRLAGFMEQCVCC